MGFFSVWWPQNGLAHPAKGGMCNPIPPNLPNKITASPHLKKINSLNSNQFCLIYTLWHNLCVIKVIQLPFNMRKIIIPCLVLFFSAIQAQDLINSRKTSFHTYIFKLTDQEARKIYRKDLWKVKESFFHTIVDSFPTDSIYKKVLPPGHYLKAYSEKNKLRFDITSVQNFDVKILKNNTDLCIGIYDPEGNIITDANVSVRWKNISYDKKTRSYIDKKSNQKGLLKVTHDGFTAYYNLKRRYNNSLYKRTVGKVVYGTPVRYVWAPVKYVICLPVDAIRSLVEGHPRGIISRTGRFFEKSFRKIACLFDEYYCDYYGENKFQNKHNGYMVFNKPKYMPGDTVKFKSFIVTKKGKPVNRQVDVVLWTRKKHIVLTKLEPYRNGGYEYKFFLHDSLNLQLDMNYSVSLKLKNGKSYISRSFRYEDYELSKIKLELRTESDKHYKGKDITIFAKGTDENDLNLLDARLEVHVKPKDVTRFFGNYVFIPDTLMYVDLKLDTEVETEISVPGLVFPDANLTYDVVVDLFTADNEKVSKVTGLSYYHHINEIDYKLESDTLKIKYLLNGEEKAAMSGIYGIDNFRNKNLVITSDLPAKIVINPYYSDYFIETDSVKETINISREPALLQCFSERSVDSIHIMIQNPRNISFSYFIYKKNIEKDRDYSESLNYNISTTSKQTYFIALQYLWGGRMINENYRIPYIDKKLTVTVTEPKIVYPSQDTEIELLVTDNIGNPVPDVDLTAYSITKKFNYSPPNLPYLGKSRKDKTVINNFRFENYNFGNHTGLNLNYKEWKLLAGIDSIEYYKFIYPGDEIYRNEYLPNNSLTQFAPFLTSNGAIVPIHIIYVDSKPVYFSWSTNTQPYSFPVDSGYHKIKLRTAHRIFEIDSLYFTYGKKLIFSIRDSIKHKHVSVKKSEPKLSSYEKRLLYKYIIPYRYKFGEQFAYIEQNGKVQFLKPAPSWAYGNMAGPVTANNISFHLVDNFSIDFVHEPFFEYEFAPGLLKMRSVDPKGNYPVYLLRYRAVENLSEEVLTKEKILDNWKNYVNWKRYSTARYSYQQTTSQGKGSLLIELQKKEDNDINRPLNILLFRYDNHEFLRVYPGSTFTYYDLDRGYHKVLFFYPGSRYFIADSIYVAADGINYHRLSYPEVLKKDTFSIYVSKIIEENIFRIKSYYEAEKTELKQIYNLYQKQYTYTGEGHIVEGYVYDLNNVPLPGVNVVVKGTNFGTVSDVEGFYSIKVPGYASTLVFSFIGYMQEEVNVGSKDIANVNMVEELMQLEEVVVVGYGVQRKEMLTATVSTVTTEEMLFYESDLTGALMGRVSGVDISKAAISGSGVTFYVRGASTSKFMAEPLYVIDGKVFTGNIEELNSELIKDIQILEGASATAIYGSRGANGVVLISTGGVFKSTSLMPALGADYDETFLEAALQSSSIRDNFSDYAFWQPTLVTDKEGKATFNVTFPDDVTSWRTFYLAMNGKRQSGQAEGLIKSYKPLMAQLAVPRFLVNGDTTCALGKVLNYTPDSIELNTIFEINDNSVFNKKQVCIRSIIDTLEITATGDDSLKVKYYLEKEDGYFDGEQRTIPVFPTGLEETYGQFFVLDKDTAVEMTFDSALGEVKLYASADVLEVIEDEISRVIRYKYSCNEQVASKLKALLAENHIRKYQGKKFKKNKQIERLIRSLVKNRKDEGLWGWWKNSEVTSLWISLHVLEALAQAKKMGYKVNINEDQITENLVWELESQISVGNKLRALKTLRMINNKFNCSAYINDIEKRKNLSLNQKLQLIELKQLCGVGFALDSVFNYKKETIFGNIYFEEDSNRFDLLDNTIQNTLTAYCIIRNDSSANHEDCLLKIRNYLFEKRSSGHWTNTYESAQIIETILPDILVGKENPEQPSLSFSGAVNKTIDEFPFETTLSATDTIKVSKKGDLPVYLTAYQRYWNPTPKEKKSDFEITTSFKDLDSKLVLNTGEEVKLIVDVKVIKDADYAMIIVPIPAGCSYASKRNNYYNEVHREYFRNETSIFCEKLKKGDYKFEIELMPRYTGKYNLNPAKVELMYFPTFNANNEMKKVTVNKDH